MKLLTLLRCALAKLCACRSPLTMVTFIFNNLPRQATWPGSVSCVAFVAPP